jgi:hypothetical protein
MSYSGGCNSVFGFRGEHYCGKGVVALFEGVRGSPVEVFAVYGVDGGGRFGEAYGFDGGVEDFLVGGWVDLDGAA